jgi:tyrosyl-tRNA synthetase
MYAKVMSWPDGVLSSAFELCTFLNWEEIKNIDINKNPRDSKMRLAFEITKINHGQEKALAAQEHFIKTVQNKEIPDDIPEITIKTGVYALVDLLVLTKLVASKGEARRLITQGGIKVGMADKLEVQNNPQVEISITENLIIQRGKRQFIKIHLV